MGKSSFESVIDRDIKKFGKDDYLRYYSKRGEDDKFSVDRITEITRCAFTNCKRLESVYLPERVTEINADTFFGCKSLKDIDLKNITAIGDCAFYDCRNLNEISFGRELKSIGKNAFSCCENFDKFAYETLLLDGEHQPYYGYEHLSGELYFAENIESVGEYAFANCNGIEKVAYDVENVINIIEAGTFTGCEKLREITFPNKLRIIDKFAFANCRSLREVHIENGVQFIGEGAFMNCTSLEKIEMSSMLRKIGKDVFKGCKNLKDIYYFGSKENWENIDFRGKSDTTRALKNNIPTNIYTEIGLQGLVVTLHFSCGETSRARTFSDGALHGVMSKLGELNSRGMVFGTERTRALLDALGSPDKKLKIIHVAGTNGKGSVCAYISSVLNTCGKKTGVYTSPFIYDITEQFSIGGEPITEDLLAAALNTVLKLDLQDATRFEVETVAAIYAFYVTGCEYAVLECGMGGLNDATNAVKIKELAVITSISLEHTKFLGDTLEKICGQKAGIIRDCPVVASAYQPPEARAYFEKLGAVFPDGVKVLKPGGTAFGYGGEEYSLGICGVAQPYNAALAIEALKLLGITDTRAIKAGLARAEILGRLEKIHSDGRLYILDGAHNPASIECLCENLKDMNPTVIYGCLSDKDIDGCVNQLAKIAKRLIAVKPDSPRAMDSDKIYSTCKKYFKRAERAENVAAALDNACADGGTVVVCGSFTLLKEAKQWIEKRS